LFCWLLSQKQASSVVLNLLKNMVNLIWTGVVVLFVLWILGFALHVGGGLIHLLIVLALIGLAYNLITGRGAV
jgi:Family of unknown function (DUF5670)